MNGRRSIAPRREWDDRHFMNREPSLIDLGAHRAARAHQRRRRARSSTARASSGPDGSDVPPEHGGARAGSAQLTYRDFADGGLRPTTEPRRRSGQHTRARMR